MPTDILSGLSNLIFYEQIQTYLRDRIGDFQSRILGNFAELLGVTALSLLTIWIFWQGWRVVSGRSREPMMALVGDSLKAMLIIGIATGWAGNSTSLYTKLTDGLGKAIYGAVTGTTDDIDSMYHVMDANLAVTTAALGAISAVEKGRDGSGQGNSVSDDMLIEAVAAFGTGGPALAGGTMITLNKLAMAMFTGFGPFFIMCLLFDATKPLFQKWLFYGIGTMFSLAVLYVVLIIATEMMLAVAATFWLSSALVQNPDGMRTVSIQTGGLGIILTMLIVTGPPMAAAFFNGMLGQFNPYAAIGPGSSTSPHGQRAPVQVQSQRALQPSGAASGEGNLVASGSGRRWGGSVEQATQGAQGVLANHPDTKR